MEIDRRTSEMLTLAGLDRRDTYTADEVGAVLGLTGRQIRNRISEAQIEAERFGRAYRIPLRELDRIVVAGTWRW